MRSHRFTLVWGMVIVLFANLFSQNINLSPVGHFGGDVYAMAMDSHYAYVSQGINFVVLDIANPALPQRVGELALTQVPADMVVQNGLAYALMTNNTGFLIIDVANPAAPQLLGSCNANSQYGGNVCVNGPYAYATDWRNGVSIIDVSNPTNPAVEHVINWPARDVKTNGNYLYIAGGDSSQTTPFGVKVFDLANPAAPTEVSFFATNETRRICIKDPYAYITIAMYPYYMLILDISDPRNIRSLANVQTGSWGYSIDVAAGYAYIGGSSFRVFNVSNPQAPAFLKTVNLVGESWAARHIKVVPPYAYVSVSGSYQGLQIFNIANPANPQATGNFKEPDLITQTLVKDNRLYLTGPGSVWKYDLANPEAPGLLNDLHFTTFQERLIALDNNILCMMPFMNSGQQYIKFYDVTQPSAITEVGAYNAAGYCSGMQALNKKMYLINDAGVVETIDISNPAAATSKSFFLTGKKQRFIHVQDNWGYIGYEQSATDRGIIVCDLAASSSQVKGLVKTAATPQCVAVSKDTLFVGSNKDSTWYFQVFNIKTPNKAALIAQISGKGAVWGMQRMLQKTFIAIEGGSVYVIECLKGMLKILDKCPSPGSVSVAVTEPDANGTGYIYTAEGYWCTDEKKVQGTLGVYMQTYETKSDDCCLVSRVKPGEAKDVGCQALPSQPEYGPCQTWVGVKAITVAPWNFDHWEGAATGRNPDTLGWRDNKCSEAWAVFVKPILTLSGGLGLNWVCPDTSVLYKGVVILPFQLAANEVATWQLYDISFKSWGDGNELKDLAKVKLYKNKDVLIGEGLYTEDNGTIKINITKTTQIPKGESVSFNLEYVFKKETVFDTLKGYNVETNVLFVNAKPVAPAFANYLKLPPPPEAIKGGPTYIAGVTNVNTQKKYALIHQALKDPITLDGHVIEVCPGVYTENVVVDKSVIIQSTCGWPKTIVQAKNESDHVFTVTKPNVRIIGFTVKGAKANLKAGIFCTTPTAINGYFSKNYLTANDRGVSFVNVNSQIIEKNLISDNKDAGVALQGSTTTNIKIRGNIIGLDSTSTQKQPNNIGIGLRDGAHHNLIGGTGSEERNIVSGNKFSGIELENAGTDYNKIAGNYIGTDGTGEKALGNGIGVFILGKAKNDTIGGFSDSERNIISGNTEDGILLSFKETKHHMILNNFIGTNKTGTAAVPNLKNGIQFYWLPSENWIGTYQGGGNLISGNNGHGIYITEGSSNNEVLGNKVGTDRDGTSAIPNLGYGIIVESASSENHIGGKLEGKQLTLKGNLISGNKKSGMLIHGIGLASRSIENQILGNYIGTDQFCTKPLPNEEYGLVLASQANENWIGSLYGGGNVISGNKKSGILCKDRLAYHNFILSNCIGTNWNGTVAIANHEHGIEITQEAQDVQIGIVPYDKKQYKGNLISGNRKNGIYIHGQWTMEIYIAANWIGLDGSGTKALPNGENGIEIAKGAQGFFIGGEPNAGNVISGNMKHGIYIHGPYCFITDMASNYIGTDKTGQYAVGNKGNGICILDRAWNNCIGGEVFDFRGDGFDNGNVISGNELNGIMIGNNVWNTDIVHNIIGSTAQQNGKLPNKRHGIEVINAHATWIGIEKHHCNVISGNALDGVHVENSWNVCIGGNVIGMNKKQNLYMGNGRYGVMNDAGHHTIITLNYISGNCGGIMDKGEETEIYQNTIDYNKCSTAIHLVNASPEIIGNRITRDQSDGIFCEQGSRPTIQQNWLENNNSYDLVNTDPSVTIEAQSNWWGSPSGPGRKVNGAVNFTNWLIAPPSLILSATADTLLISSSQSDSLLCVLQNWTSFAENIQLSIVTDAADWLAAPVPNTVSWQDSGGAVLPIKLTVPANVAKGVIKKFRLTAISQVSSASASDSFFVRVYSGGLARIAINPSPAHVRLGGTIHFTAIGIDSIGRSVDVAALWTATGGAIDSSGQYATGDQTGLFSVQAKDPNTHLQVEAPLHIYPLLAGLTLLPEQPMLKPGETQQFQVQGYDSSGASCPVFPQWYAEGGSISNSGLYIAGADTGRFTVSVTDSLSDAATFTRITIAGMVHVDKDPKSRSMEDYYVFQNYPNPFNPVTMIEYSIKEACHVQVTVYDIRGREVAILVNEPQMPGLYRVPFSSNQRASGIYFYRFQAGTFTRTGKMLLLK